MCRNLTWLGALLAATALAAAQPPDAGAPPGPLTPTQLGETLRKLGFEPETISKTKDWYRFPIDRDGLKIYYNVRLYNKNRLLLFTNLVEIPENAPAPALRRLLEENDTLGRSNFIYNKGDK